MTAAKLGRVAGTVVGKFNKTTTKNRTPVNFTKNDISSPIIKEGTIIGVRGEIVVLLKVSNGYLYEFLISLKLVNSRYSKFY